MLIKVIIHEQFFGDPNDSRVNDNKTLVSKDDSASLKESTGLHCLSFCLLIILFLFCLIPTQLSILLIPLSSTTSRLGRFSRCDARNAILFNTGRIKLVCCQNELYN